MASLSSLFVLSLGCLASAKEFHGTVTSLPLHATVTNAPRALVTPTTSPLPLSDYTYAYTDLPYQVNPYNIGRGPQSGYNQCNNSTEGPDSQCQTAIMNSISDFCLWGAPGLTSNGQVGSVEAAVVAYCTRAGHGARIMPAGTITAVQFMRTPAYIQITGWINQTGLNLAANDTGGELDPHGDDGLGNPLGGLVYSTSMPNGDNKTEAQVQQWNSFVGGGMFSFKLCDLSYPTTVNYCYNQDDVVGLYYNAPAAYAPDVFLECDGDLQDEVGVYTSAGKTYTWSEPSSLAADFTLPYTPRIPASSNCVTYQSTDLFQTASLGYQYKGASTTASSSAATRTGSSGASGSASRTGSVSASASSTSTVKASSAGANAAKKVLVLLGAVAAAAFVV